MSNLKNRRRQHAFGQRAARAIKPGADFVGRFVQVDAVIELNADVGRAFRRSRVDAVNARRGAQTGFERARDEVLDFFGRDAGIFGAHRDRRALHFRHQVYRQSDERDDAEQNHHGRKHIDHDRVIY